MDIELQKTDLGEKRKSVNTMDSLHRYCEQYCEKNLGCTCWGQ